MKISRTALSAMIAGVCFTGQAFAQQSRPSKTVQTVSYTDEGAAQASPSDAQAKAPAAAAPAVASSAGCDAGCDSSCNGGCDGGWKFGRGAKGCDGIGSGCGNGSCDGNGCGCGGSGACDGNGGCDGCGCSGAGLGSGGIFSSLFSGWKVGGWSDVGYHTSNNAGLGVFGNGVPANFNNYDGRVQLQQQWFYAEKIADGSKGLGLGGRMDYIYGTDGPDTQAFGRPDNHWDNPWDNGGAYGHAIPQLYGEIAYGDMSLKVGKFFTLIGNEVVQATGNFFYSRQFTFYNAQPFTHTGALAQYKVDENTTIWNGYVQGWDSGFKDNGDAYLGGAKRTLATGQTLSLHSVLGRFSDHPAFQERGTGHCLILTTPLTEKLTHINQVDYLFTNNAAGVGLRNTFGNINYLIYQLNDTWSLGQRFEWFNYSSEVNGIKNADIYNHTVGVNYRPMKNLVFRPEVRWIWDKEKLGVNEGGFGTATVFGTDMVFSY